MNTTMHRRVAMTIKLGLGVNHLARFLRTGGAVEISQRQTVYLTRKHRKVGPHFVDGKNHLAPPRQPLTDSGQHLLFKPLITQCFRQFGSEGVNDHLLGILLIDPARAQIEYLFIINTPHRRAVAAFHIICIDFQLRFRIHFRQFAHQQIVVGHLTIRFDGVLRDVDQTVKYRAAFVADDSFVQLSAVTKTFIVFQPGTGITHLVFHRHRQAIDPQRAVFAIELRTGVVS